MAERSTAAVDVADNSGDDPLTAKADKAASDGVAEEQDVAERSARDSDGERRDSEQSVITAPELHSGHKLARRYRLEECVTRLDGFSSWRAVDEKLRRAVGVHILPADHPRARSVLAAARSSALLGDPRFVQVLDAVEENDLVYVVHEWLPDATELTTLLAAGPLEPHDAYQLVSQVSQAMAAAHREGLAHLRLTPSAVLRSSTGQYRIRGLAVNAALRGISADRPQRTDTEAIGALLYAALTKRWPYEDDAYGLSGLPKGVGLIPPDQVRAGVHRGLSELAMRALVNDGATASRQEPPCTTPDELAKAVAAMPRIRPPEPDFPTPPEYQRTTYQQGNYGRTQPRPGSAATMAVPVPPPPLQSRTGKALKWAVSALLIAALGLGSWQVADRLLEQKSNGQTGDTGTQTSPGGQNQKKPVKPPQPVRISDAHEYKPGGSGIQEDEVSNAVDGKTDTAWITPQYFGYANFGNYQNRKQGSGIIVDLGSVQNVRGLDVTMYRSGQKAQVFAAGEEATDPSGRDDFPHRLTELKTVGDTLKTTVDKPVRTRYVLIHITELPPDGSGGYRGGISEIKVLG
ncbi:serine/threonine protein kinase [Streptomyces sp. WAC05374]|uniref:protein kinase family protein n=1 Tax=Streptomyces sp. WAC05374 TaxID=2487420 RepID=UPI000F8988AC|nr:protein kinase family protein [Streptomyces sp. WAC05374]RST17973.1 serine/threonine protein kinase [Streptomyces sp. WAC05374]TDF44587.1 serine/threonine protein kinase [Streptomyces sp. WAC05374]TDF56626.1 serine/threonine protein kinase [Streptomyces sp. WAC05374]TDF59998.1 serine/threonine protein kinase [Streptomyces sp. WAC05374]